MKTPHNLIWEERWKFKRLEVKIGRHCANFKRKKFRYWEKLQNSAWMLDGKLLSKFTWPIYKFNNLFITILLLISLKFCLTVCHFVWWWIRTKEESCNKWSQESSKSKTEMHAMHVRTTIFTPPDLKAEYIGSCKEFKKNKTGVINDPLGQTHSLASSEYCFRFVLFC